MPFSQRILLLAIPVSGLVLINPTPVYNSNVWATPNISTFNASLAISPPSSLDPDSKNLSARAIQCNAESYGRNLRLDSCVDAYQQIRQIVNIYSWGPRTQGRWDINLPWRGYSCKWSDSAIHNHYVIQSVRSLKAMFTSVFKSCNMLRVEWHVLSRSCCWISSRSTGFDANLQTADGLCAIEISARSGLAISDRASWYDISQVVDGLIEKCVQPHSIGGAMRNVGM